MASRSERREFNRIEAVVKLVVFGVVAFALLLGGITGFAGALMAIVFVIIIIAVVAIAVFGILKSRLFAQKKLGLLLIIAALLLVWFWNGARAPRPWPEERAMVVSVSGPPAVTETVYAYHPQEAAKGVLLTTVQSKSWARLIQAKNYQAATAGVYYNPANPNEVRFDAVNKWRHTTANPVKTKIIVTGEGTATVQLGSPFFPKTATISGLQVADYTAGTRFQVWLNPDNPAEFSFQPRTTESGRKYWMVTLAGLMAFGGIGALVVGKQWADPSKPPPPKMTFADMGFGRSVAPSTTSIASLLRAIDWFQFEAVAARILESEGWVVQKFGGANPDGGADLLAIKNGRRSVVQCKHWRRIEVQPKIIRELLGTKTSAQFRADGAVLFTLSNCTAAALACAKENDVTIYNSVAIEAAIQRLGVERFSELVRPDSKHCPKCGAAMILRDKVETPFWGCSTYPRCRGTIERS